MKIPASAKYDIIEQMMQREDNMLNIKWLCETAGVSRPLVIITFFVRNNGSITEPLSRISNTAFVPL